MSTLTRSATLPYATGNLGTLTATALRLLLDPRDVGPIRLLGVGFSGLSDVRQESLFPDLEQQEAEVVDTPDTPAPTPERAPDAGGWRIGDDVRHPEFGHGWVQGAGHGVVSVRFETRGSGPGVMRTFPIDHPDLLKANPVDSLDWADYVAEIEDRARSAQALDDVGDRQPHP